MIQVACNHLVWIFSGSCNPVLFIGTMNIAMFMNCKRGPEIKTKTALGKETMPSDQLLQQGRIRRNHPSSC